MSGIATAWAGSLEQRGTGCEFCDELRTPWLSRFTMIYGSQVRSRVITQRDGLVVMPTLGQMVKGSLLLLPEAHFETMADLPWVMQRTLLVLIDEMERFVRHFGMPVLFEHGAKYGTGGGCGIYHAHLHLVPVPWHMHWHDILPSSAWIASGVRDAYRHLACADAYLLFRDTGGRHAVLELGTEDVAAYPSQYFRRMLARWLGPQVPWDWRAYNHVEPWLIATLAAAKDNHVPFGR